MRKELARVEKVAMWLVGSFETRETGSGRTQTRWANRHARLACYRLRGFGLQHVSKHLLIVLSGLWDYSHPRGTAFAQAIGGIVRSPP